MDPNDNSQQTPPNDDTFDVPEQDATTNPDDMQDDTGQPGQDMPSEEPAGAPGPASTDGSGGGAPQQSDPAASSTTDDGSEDWHQPVESADENSAEN